ncbi:inositol monophosphatase, partial [Nocardia sp. NPDC004722]
MPESNFTTPAPAAVDTDAPAARNTDTSDIAELRRVAVYLAETAAAHVRARRPEVFGPHANEPDAV